MVKRYRTLRPHSLDASHLILVRQVESNELSGLPDTYPYGQTHESFLECVWGLVSAPSVAGPSVFE